MILRTQGILENVLCGRLLLHVYVVHEAHARRPSTSESPGNSMELHVFPRRPLRGPKVAMTSTSAV